MSSYYGDGPYSLENWNTLIGDVNDVLENPPSGCDPLEPLEEATDPHIWTTDDVEEVRNALMETCPDIVFSEELELWKKGIIDEIVEQMEEAWCDCDEDYTTLTEYLGSFSSSPFHCAQGPNCCCNTVKSSGTPGVCVGGEAMIQTQHSGDVYPLIGFPSVDLSAAHDANLLFLNTIQYILIYGRYIEDYQNKVDTNAAAVDLNIDLYNSTHNVIYLSRICSYGALAEHYQELVDTYVTLFQEKYANLPGEESEANSLAEAAIGTLAGAATRFPVDVNSWPLCYSALAGKYPWKKWIDPRHDSGGDVAKIRPKSIFKCDKSIFGMPYTSFRYMRFSPNGTPYPIPLGGSGLSGFRFSLALAYNTRQIRYYCDALPGGICPHRTADGTICDYTKHCQWSNWCDDNARGESQCWHSASPTAVLCVCGFRPTTSTYVPYVTTRYYPSRIGDDHTELQDQMWDEYNTWYITHPQYDNRHESYC